MKLKHLLFIFIPAICIVIFALFTRVIQYEPLYPKQEETQKDETGNISVIPIYPEDPVIGEKTAPTTIISFEDFGCSHCKAQMGLMSELLKKYPKKIKMIWKGIPVTRFPYSTETALKYSHCANLQKKFTQFADQAFDNYMELTDDKLKEISATIGLDQADLDECLAAESTGKYTEKNYNLALALNIQSVPTFFINNKQIQTPTSLTEWKALLEIKD